eukprot:gene7742-7196_t
MENEKAFEADLPSSPAPNPNPSVPAPDPFALQPSREGAARLSWTDISSSYSDSDDHAERKPNATPPGGPPPPPPPRRVPPKAVEGHGKDGDGKKQKRDKKDR